LRDWYPIVSAAAWVAVVFSFVDVGLDSFVVGGAFVVVVDDFLVVVFVVFDGDD